MVESGVNSPMLALMNISSAKDRRAATAKKYLTDLGIASSRISLLSYGKEKPVCATDSEACWQKNRRDDFAVITP
jgi:outer membrane protein OmpA-like peptidoglycan-associated protein